MGAAGMSAFGLDEGKEAAEFLSYTWSHQQNKDVWSLWEGKGLIRGCLTEKGCLSDAPMLAQLQEVTSHYSEIKRNFTINAANVETGDYVSFNQTNTALEDLA